MYYGSVVQFSLWLVLVYVPGVQTVLVSADPGYKPWVVLLVVGFIIVVFNEWRKYRIRNFPDERLSKELLW